MKLSLVVYWAIATIAFASCTPSENAPRSQIQPSSSQKVVTLDENFKIVMGQTVYVPVYSHIYHQDKKQTFDLAATLSVRNTDLNDAIVITAVRYYDSEGKLVRKYIDRPIEIAALASVDYFVDTTDTSGGSGAKFIVEWVAPTKVSEPALEAIMIGSGFQQGISFVSPGRVIKTHRDRNSLLKND
jgi:Protein of unknown function (DUF3124)